MDFRPLVSVTVAPSTPTTGEQPLTQDGAEHLAENGKPSESQVGSTLPTYGASDCPDDYLRIITEYVSAGGNLRIEKSWQLRVTWVLAALMVHKALLNQGEKNGYTRTPLESVSRLSSSPWPPPVGGDRISIDVDPNPATKGHQ